MGVMSSHRLTRLLLEGLSDRTADGAHGGQLEAALEDLMQAARSAWPELSLPAEVFLPYLAQRLPAEQELLEGLQGIRASDLFLACACARGEEQAAVLFEVHYAPEMDTALGRLNIDQTLADEVKQVMRQRLLVDQAPAITKYSGRGSLDGWVRVTVTRAAFKQLGKDKKEVPVEDDLLQAAHEMAEDPELQHLKQLYRREFKDAFGQAMGELSPRQRNMLRHQFIDRLTIDQIGELYGVHRATAARWLDRARQAVVQGSRRAMMQHLRVHRGEYESIMRLIQSQVDLSITRHLRLRVEPEDDA